MKVLIRYLVIYTVILFFLQIIIPGLMIHGGFITYIIGGAGLTFMFLIIKPILNIISFPINFLTLGLFSILTNGLIIYVLTSFIPNISISAFSYKATNLYDFEIPKISFNVFFAYIYSSFMLSFIDSFIKWLMR